MELLSGLGQLIRLSDSPPDLVYLGGLDRNGTDGEFAYFWQDEITQGLGYPVICVSSVNIVYLHYSDFPCGHSYA